MASQSANRDVAALVAYVAEVVQAADVNKRLRRGEPQLHQRQQRLPSGDVLGLIAVLVDERECLIDRPSPLVGKRCRNHRASPSLAAASAAATVLARGDDPPEPPAAASAAAMIARTMLW